MEIKEIIGGTICMLLFMINLIGWSFIGKVYEDQIRCENGATQFCMEK